MPVLLGNGRDVITVNGHRVQYQGIGHLRPDMPTDAAVEKTKHSGLDEYFINVKDEQGRTQRILVYGDHLDFSFRNSHSEPEVTVNGKQGKLVAFESEPNDFFRGVIEGAKSSLGDAFDALGTVAKGIIGSSSSTTALTVAGVTGVSVFGGVALLSGTGMIHAGILTTLMAAAQPITYAALGVAAVAMLIVAISGAIKGGSNAMLNHPKMETIAAVMGESNDLQSQKPFNPAAPDPDRPEPPPVANPVKPPVFDAPQQSTPKVSRPVRPPMRMVPVPPADPGLAGNTPSGGFQRHRF
jgi:hypothetical protein